jgi:polyhydroxyalkanoate synthesis regulator phasin
MKNKKQEKELKVKIANLYIKNAESQMSKKSPENLQSALRSYEDALVLYQNLKSKENISMLTGKIEELKQKVAEYDPFAT